MSRENKTEFPRTGFTVTDEDITKLEVDLSPGSEPRPTSVPVFEDINKWGDNRKLP